MSDIESFHSDRALRFGTANPERVRSRHLERMVRTDMTPYRVRSELGMDYPGHPHEDVRPPEWCFHRFGMSQTRMDDGRIICIAGEHEDWYDPDFCIYNDVVVLRPGPGEAWITEHTGEVEIYHYPREVFTPTDFHSATLVKCDGEQDGLIYVIGNLGYKDARVFGHTPIAVLDTRTYEIKQLHASGDCPGWISKHHATYDNQLNAITVRGGEIMSADDGDFKPNRSVYRLHLSDMRWERIAVHERWRAFRLEAEEDSSRLVDDLDDFRPVNVPHTVLESRPFWDPMWFAIDVMGIRVECSPRVTQLEITIEGELPDDVVEHLMADIRARVSGDGPLWTVEETTAE